MYIQKTFTRSCARIYLMFTGYEIFIYGGIWGIVIWLISVFWKEWHDGVTKYAEEDHNDHEMKSYLLRSRKRKTFLGFWILGIIIYLITTGELFPSLYAN